MLKYIRFWFAALGFFTIFSDFSAALAASTTFTPLSTTAWTDLGAGPMELSATGQTVYQIADTPPSTANGLGFPVPVDVPRCVSTTSHVYAMVRAGDATHASAISASVSACGGSSGGQSIAIGAGNLATGQVSVTTAPTLIVAARSGRTALTVINTTGSAALCLGPTNAVTPSNGECLPAIAGASHTFNYSGVLYGIATTAQTVSYAETY